MKKYLVEYKNISKMKRHMIVQAKNKTEARSAAYKEGFHLEGVQSIQSIMEVK